MKKVSLLLMYLLFGGVSFIYAQTQISGTVSSAVDGEPLPGVSVVVQGTTIGTATDINGTYSFEIPEDAEVLTYSSVGMKSQEVNINGRTTIDVVMEQDVVGLDEVVVTALGIKRSEKALGYSASTVTSEEITETRNTDVVSSLRGKVAGVQITTTSSDPGASNSVIIRGVSSLNQNNQPLYVIDGVPMINNTVTSDDFLNNGYDYGNGANMVNPDDVESVSILKGAAATALYGSRAANGVVVITTKTGASSDGFGVEINSSVVGSDILRLPTFQNEYGMGWSGEHTQIENGSWGPLMDGSMRLWGTVYNNSQKLKPFSPQEDNVKDFFDYGIKYQNSVAFSGNSEQTNYYLSFSQVNNDGMIPGENDTYNRYTASIRGSHQFGKALNVSTSINYADQANIFSPTGQGLTMINSIYQIPRDISIIQFADYETDPFDHPYYFFTPYGITNPYWLLDKVENEFNQNKVYGKLQADLNLLNRLTLTYRLGFDATSNETKLGNPRIEAPAGVPNFDQIDQEGFVTKQGIRQYEMNHDFLLNYSSILNDFSLNMIGGANILDKRYSLVSSTVNGLDIPTYYDLSNSSASPVVNEDLQKKRLYGIFAQAELGFQESIFLTLTARNDWSSTLPENNNSFFYPGATLSIVFSEYLPDNMSDVLSLGKIRLAYGQTGNDAPVYVVNPVFVQTEVYNEFGDIRLPLAGINGFGVGDRLGNLNLSPEITTEAEVGMNLNFFQGRIELDAAYYNKVSDKQIFELGIDPATGYTRQTTNLGEIENQGFELLASVMPVRTNNFRWTLSLNYTTNESKVLSLPDELGDEVTIYSFGTANATTSLVATEGQPLGQFKVTVPQRTPDGKIVVNPEDGMPVPDDELQVVGDMNFDYEMGIANRFSWKGLNLGIVVDARRGGLMYSRTADITAFTGNSIQTLYNDRRPFIVPNSVNAIENEDGSVTYVENSTNITKNDLWDYFQNGTDELNEYFLIPRDYVKLRSVSLGYDLPSRLFANIPIQSLTVSVFGTNLALWTPTGNTYIDPEIQSWGNDLQGRFGEYSANPTARTFGANLKINF